MLKLNLGKYEIRRENELNIGIFEKRIAEDGKNKGEIVEKNTGHFGTLEEALTGYVKRCTRSEEFQGDAVEEIRNSLRNIEATIENVCKNIEI